MNFWRVAGAVRFSTRSRHPIANGTDKPAGEESMASGAGTSDRTISFGHPVVIPSFFYLHNHKSGFQMLLLI